MAATRAPGWLTWLLTGGLLLVFVGERIVATSPPWRLALTGLGAALVVASTLRRALAWRRSAGEARSVEGILLLAHGGCLAALALYALGTDPVRGALGLELAAPETDERVRTALQVIWTLILGVSLLPVLAAAWALGPGRAGGEADEVEALRVRDTAASGLTVALAGAALLLLGWVAHDRDPTVDLSYFRTAAPGSSTREMVAALEDPLRVLLFFPEVSDVKDEVRTYFEALADATGRIEIEEYDRLEAPEVAQRYVATADGTIVLVTGERDERFRVSMNLATARSLLRRMDAEVQARLLTLIRERRTVYLTVGHGELNDPGSAGPLVGERDVGVAALRQLLEALNYDVAELGLGSGLGGEVPPDAAAVLVLGPRASLLEGEVAALDDYFAGGGSLLLALDPDTEVSLGALERRLGLAVNPAPLADDRQYLRRRGNPSDRRLLVTDRFSAHASVSTLSRMGVGSGVLLAGAGSLEEVDSAGTADLRRTYVVRSLPSTFRDEDRDFVFDAEEEERTSWPVVAAVEVRRTVGEEDEGGARALVAADADLFSDLVLGNIGLNAALAADAIRWLGREEELAGETISEEDVPIVHTRGEDVAWFYSTIVGAPALVLVLGLVGIRARRRLKGGGAE